MDEKTKTRVILEHLMNGEFINDMKAAQLCKSYRLSAIIFNLRKYGYNIQDVWRENKNTGNRYKDYFIPELDRIELN